MQSQHTQQLLALATLRICQITSCPQPSPDLFCVTQRHGRYCHVQTNCTTDDAPQTFRFVTIQNSTSSAPKHLLDRALTDNDNDPVSACHCRCALGAVVAVPCLEDAAVLAVPLLPAGN